MSTEGTPETVVGHQKSVGACREAVWNALEGGGLCSFPLPPHGHCPNFKGARAAAEYLLAFSEIAALSTLIVGPERVLMPVRKLALERGKVLYVPHQQKQGWYWRLTHPFGANLSQMAAVGEPKLRTEEAQAAVLACVAVDRRGGRLGKGYGWGARGLNLGVPEFTVAHPLMLCERLDCLPDSVVSLIGTPQGVIQMPFP